MKTRILALAVGLCLIGLSGQAWAAETSTISVTVSLQEVISVSVSPSTWDIGAIALSGTNGPASFSATNDGNVSEDLSIAGTDGAGGWTLAATAGADAFSVQVDDGVSPFALTTGGSSLASNVAKDGSAGFDLTFGAPTDDTFGGGVDQSFSVTVTATKYVP